MWFRKSSQLLLAIAAFSALLAAGISWTFCQGKIARQQAIALSDLGEQIWIAGDIYMMEHDGAYPSSIAQLDSSEYLSRNPIEAAYHFAAARLNQPGGFSYFVFSNGDSSSQVVVLYGAKPSWQEVFFSLCCSPFDTSNLDTRAHNPEWIRSPQANLDWIGGSCGSVDIRLARGLEFEEVRSRLTEYYSYLDCELAYVATE